MSFLLIIAFVVFQGNHSLGITTIRTTSVFLLHYQFIHNSTAVFITDTDNQNEMCTLLGVLIGFDYNLSTTLSKHSRPLLE